MRDAHQLQGNLRCRLTRLTHLDLSMHESKYQAPSRRLCVGNLPDGITALQRLQHLRLGCCITIPLAPSISCLTQLTCLELIHDEQIIKWRWEAFDRLEVRPACCFYVACAQEQQCGSWLVCFLA